MNEYILETNDLILKKGELSDWKDLYKNIWSRKESAKYMLWKVINTEDEARERNRKCLTAQEDSPYNWTIYEKKTGQAIGWAVLDEIEKGIFEDQGIAIGPDFAGKGYGKQIMYVLLDFVRRQQNAKKMICSYRSQNAAAKKTLEGCGFEHSHYEDKVDRRNGQQYELVYMFKNI